MVAEKDHGKRFTATFRAGVILRTLRSCVVFNTGPCTVLPHNSILITAKMQSETGFLSSHQLKSYVASKSRLKLAARAVLSADAGLLVVHRDWKRAVFVLYIFKMNVRSTKLQLFSWTICGGHALVMEVPSQLSSLHVSNTLQELDTGFPMRHQPRFYAAPNFLKMGIN